MHRFLFVLKAWGILLGFALLFAIALFAFQSCSSTSDMDEEIEGPKSQFSLNMKSVPVEMMNNALLYRFDTNNKFMGRQLGVVQKPGDILYTNSVPVGTWNFTLLMCKENIFDKITQPISPYGNNDRVEDRMWKTSTTGSYLNQTPDLYHVYMGGVQIVEGLDKEVGPVTPRRNVAKVEFILEEYSGFDPINPGTNPKAYIELYNVPTSLRWDGELYPDNASPEVATQPIREYFKFDSSSPNPVAETISFVIPAHLANSVLTTNKLKFKASMPLNGQEFYGGSENKMEITSIAKANHIIRVKLKFRGQTKLDVNVTVKPWENEIGQGVGGGSDPGFDF